MFCQTCKREMTMELLPCSICEAKTLSGVSITGESFEVKMTKPYTTAPAYSNPPTEEVTDKLMHGEVTEALDDEIATQFTVSVDDLKRQKTTPPDEDMQFYADEHGSLDEEELDK